MTAVDDVQSQLKSGDKRFPKVGMVSLGCPKALVDSERILTQLKAQGYLFVSDYADADVVIVNTCGFLDSAKEESLEAISEALSENGKVVVTGCLGVYKEDLQEKFPSLIAVTGPQQYDDVVAAINHFVPILHDPRTHLPSEISVRLTPKHYAWMKIAEGCDNTCSFCIIPFLRGKLNSRPIRAVLKEAEMLVNSGVKEILIISQDTAAYGKDIGYSGGVWRDNEWKSSLLDLCKALGDLGVWVRLHYIYPYPHVDKILPLMAEGLILPYLDVPFQHAHPHILKRMRRPADQEKILKRLENWRAIVPDIAIRSTFIVGFPSETEEHFIFLLEWLEEAQIDRLGCFKYENVQGARSVEFENQVPEELKQERWERLMQTAQGISEKKLAAKVGKKITVIVDDITEQEAVCRTPWDAPDIDGRLYIDSDFSSLSSGDLVVVEIDDSDVYDLWGRLVA
jgi:ribosomal protein S12 methylthiotransferase